MGFFLAYHTITTPLFVREQKRCRGTGKERQREKGRETSLEKGSVRFERKKTTTSCSPGQGKNTDARICQCDATGMVVPVDPDYCTRTFKKKGMACKLSALL
ncbi:hypothetical protein OIU84_015104 [Salix udensis]|uniref:Uncharacterized protein n=1 Tax=Salix udensis TaxID=889485 RepID=A0AAD6JDJ5_9ROSI|nr:hypothetical protein OIU84_015104 [Salix udensis]